MNAGEFGRLLVVVLVAAVAALCWLALFGDRCFVSRIDQRWFAPHRVVEQVVSSDPDSVRVENPYGISHCENRASPLGIVARLGSLATLMFGLGFFVQRFVKARPIASAVGVACICVVIIFGAQTYVYEMWSYGFSYPDRFVRELLIVAAAVAVGASLASSLGAWFGKSRQRARTT